MKHLSLLLIFLFCNDVAFSNTHCVKHFAEQHPQHFITSNYYFNGLVKEGTKQGGYSPNIMLKSGGLNKGRIVVTPALQKNLRSRGPNEIMDVYMVIVDRDTPHITRRTFTTYGFETHQRLTHFGTYWNTVLISGTRAELVRFLNNNYARNKVLWAGLSSPKDFIEQAKRWIPASTMARNESWELTEQEVVDAEYRESIRDDF